MVLLHNNCPSRRRQRFVNDATTFKMIKAARDAVLQTTYEHRYMQSKTLSQDNVAMQCIGIKVRRQRRHQHDSVDA